MLANAEVEDVGALSVVLEVVRRGEVKSSKSWAWCEAWRWRCVREESRDMSTLLSSAGIRVNM